MNNCFIPLADLFGQEALDLEDQVLKADSLSQIINYVEKFLLNKGVREMIRTRFSKNPYN